MSHVAKHGIIKQVEFLMSFVGLYISKHLLTAVTVKSVVPVLYIVGHGA